VSGFPKFRGDESGKRQAGALCGLQMRIVLSVAEEIERCADMALPGRSCTVRNEGWRQVAQMQRRLDTRRSPSERRRPIVVRLGERLK